MKTNFLKIIFGGCLGICIALNIVTLKPGQNWGGDFSQYIIHAQNLLAHRPYAEGIMVDNYVVYPPGFPLLLAPLLKVFGLNFKALKSLNVIFWYLTLLFLYPVFRRRVGEGLARSLCLLLAVSSFFFTFKQSIFSDIPFCFFAAGSLWAFSNISQPSRPRWVHWAVFIAFAAGSFWVRSAGIALWLAAAVHLLFVQKKAQTAGGVVLAFIPVLGLQVALVGTPPSYVVLLLADPPATFQFIAQNFSVIFSSFIWFLVPGLTSVTVPIYAVLETLSRISAPFLLLGIAALFIIQTTTKRISYEECFFFFYFLILMAWTAFADPPARFCRYVLPVAGLMLMFAVELLLAARKRFFPQAVSQREWTRLIILILTFVLTCNIINIAYRFDFDDDVLGKQENREMFQWVRENIPKDGHYVFWRPRTVTLMTGRVGSNLWTHPSQKPYWEERLYRKNIQYLILDTVQDQHLIQYVTHQMRVREVWQNTRYRIFKILPLTSSANL